VSPRAYRNRRSGYCAQLPPDAWSRAGLTGRDADSRGNNLSEAERATAPGRARALSQLAASPLTPAAIFLVVTVNPGPKAETAIRSLCAELANLLRAVGFRDLDGKLSCIMSFGSEVWARLFGTPHPAELHPFRKFRVGARVAPATPGDVLFHIRARRMDLCFELASQIMNRIADAVAVADEVHGFGFFDQRDLLGFVDGTENPDGEAALEAMLIGDEDPEFAGGSYVIVQKYLHDLKSWNSLSTEAQERIIGRTKLTNVELDEAVKPSFAHNELTKIVENGEEIKIVRDNMPFGEVGKGEYGTYFIGYARSPRTIEQMLENMFVGKPPGNYDRILDFSRAIPASAPSRGPFGPPASPAPLRGSGPVNREVDIPAQVERRAVGAEDQKILGILRLWQRQARRLSHPRHQGSGLRSNERFNRWIAASLGQTMGRRRPRASRCGNPSTE
jgi:porphyrinogen peroxidase